MRPRWDRSKGSPEPVRALDRIREIENGDPLVDLRIAAPDIVIVRPQTIPYCRKAVAAMAKAAARSLPKGIRLGVTDAWRPLSRQIRIYEWMLACVQEAYPERSPSSQLRTVNRWVAPPYRKAPPGHCTGAALDVILLDEQGEQIDVTSPFDRFKGAPTYVIGLDPGAARNREILVSAMLGAGFSNCRDEWWHYSFGDAGWAVRSGAAACIYGAVDLPDNLYAEQERLAEEALRERTNPFLA